MARTRDLLVLLRADWRRLASWLVAGWTLFALVVLLALVDLGCRGCPTGTIARFTAMKVLVFCLVYAMTPWILSVNVGHHGTEILTGLPLASRDIHGFVLLRGLVLGAVGLPVWGLLLWLLPRFGFEIHPWLVASTGLAILAFQLVGMVAGRYTRFGVSAVFPLLIFPPHTHRLLSGPFEFAATPWAAGILFLLIVAAWPWVLARPLPHPGRRR